jgi:hypothetical protein
MMVAAPSVVSAQEEPQVRIGAGLTSTDAHQEWGQQVLIEISLPLRTSLSLRGAGFLSFGHHFSSSRNLTEGIDLVAVLESQDLAGRPYLGGGVGYTHTGLSAGQPFRHDLGLGAVMGFELADEGGWFVEARLRYFGNVFMERVSTKSLHVFTVGRRW